MRGVQEQLGLEGRELRVQDVRTAVEAFADPGPVKDKGRAPGTPIFKGGRQEVKDGGACPKTRASPRDCGHKHSDCSAPSPGSLLFGCRQPEGKVGKAEQSPPA